ncbi:hypothetical protein IF1G_05851 [Cordyceps javanica]|uniref:Uncharacterized protein n=1 Tax=Cordyceps javanica TaxID=43265 RepID=A0A545V2U6_9HYPO|nr:hypothetical protein IF1G_05851 [Cordyceps javanica]
MSAFSSPMHPNTSSTGYQQPPARCNYGETTQSRTGEEDDSKVTNSETIMATTIADNGTMGCAFFSTQNSSLFISQDVPLADASTMQQFLESIQPSSILISEKVPKSIHKLLHAYIERACHG